MMRDAVKAFVLVTLVHLIGRNAMLWMKLGFGRLRPSQWFGKGGELWFRDGGFSFPSGHAILFASIVVPLAVLYPRARPLLVIENTDQIWLGNQSCYTSGAVAHRIWEALEVPDQMAFSQIGGSQHCAFLPAQRPLLEAYVRKFLLDEDDVDTETDVVTTDGEYELDEERWVDWETPTLD